MALACCPVPGAITAPLQALAKRHGIYIGGNQFEAPAEWPGRYFNCSFLIDPRGAVILRFRRINTALWPSPHDLMDAYLKTHGVEGTFPVIRTELGALAMVPCGEIAVPEVSRVLMMRGAEVILHPTNEPFSPPLEAAKTARAAENMVYLVSANVAGGIGFSREGSVPGGRSQIIDYSGARIAYEPDACETSAVSALVDIDALRAARRDNGLHKRCCAPASRSIGPSMRKRRSIRQNQFLDAPMTAARELAGPADKALRNLVAAGIVPETP
jgi:predicted amidohydrolase